MSHLPHVYSAEELAAALPVMRASARAYRRLEERRQARQRRAQAGGDLQWMWAEARRRRQEKEEKAAAAAVAAALVAMLLAHAAPQVFDPFALVVDPFPDLWH